MSLTSSLLLSQASWDLMLDPSGNIALLAGSPAVAQDVATAIATQTGECWLFLNYGIRFNTVVFNGPANIPLFVALYEAQARTVPTVKSALTTFSTLDNTRVLGGTVFVIDTDNTKSSVTF